MTFTSFDLKIALPRPASGRFVHEFEGADPVPDGARVRCEVLVDGKIVHTDEQGVSFR